MERTHHTSFKTLWKMFMCKQVHYVKCIKCWMRFLFNETHIVIEHHTQHTHTLHSFCHKHWEITTATTKIDAISFWRTSHRNFINIFSPSMTFRACGILVIHSSKSNTQKRAVGVSAQQKAIVGTTKTAHQLLHFVGGRASISRITYAIKTCNHWIEIIEYWHQMCRLMITKSTCNFRRAHTQRKRKYLTRNEIIITIIYK